MYAIRSYYEIEREAIKREKDGGKKLKSIAEQIANAKERLESIKAYYMWTTKRITLAIV